MWSCPFAHLLIWVYRRVRDATRAPCDPVSGDVQEGGRVGTVQERCSQLVHTEGDALQHMLSPPAPPSVARCPLPVARCPMDGRSAHMICPTACRRRPRCVAKRPMDEGALTHWLGWRLIGREGRAPRRLTFLPWLCWLACVLHGTHDADAALL